MFEKVNGMKINDEGKRFIKSHEGLRLKAYPDPGSRDGNPWTIGYGHTSLAGAPLVSRGMVITKQEADEIFERDIEKFADGVRKHIKVDLNDNQFSALVSFAYNVGLGGFAKSSALRAVNAKQFSLVPARLALWNKNDGKVLRGLVNRRAAEGALFVKPVDDQPAIEDELPEPANKVEPSEGKPAAKSTTIWTAIGAIFMALSEPVAKFFNLLEGDSVRYVTIGVVVIACTWIISERIKKARGDGV